METAKKVGEVVLVETVAHVAMAHALQDETVDAMVGATVRVIRLVLAIDQPLRIAAHVWVMWPSVRNAMHWSVQSSPYASWQPKRMAKP